tara:strand:- start:1391 stop:1849 length:459 start_codon:yes stop_codon:yes gene_type:complete
MIETSVGIKGRVLIEIYDAKTRQRIDKEWHDNLIPTAGQNAFRNAMGGFGLFPIGIGMGNSSTAPSAADVVLGSESIRKSITRRIRPRDGAIRWQAFLLETEGNGETLTESGLFNSVTVDSGDLFARVVFGAVQKTSQVFLTVTWEHEFLLA